MKILCPFFTRLALQGIVCYTFQVYCRAKVSLLLWEKVAAVRLTDEELVLRLVTPHPPLTRSPFPHWGRLFVRHESPSTFPDKHCFCVHKSEAPRKAGRGLQILLFSNN